MICKSGKPIWLFFWLVLLLGLAVFGTTQASGQESSSEKLTRLEQILRTQIAYSETLETSIMERERLLADLRQQIENLKQDLIAYQLHTQSLTRRLIAIDRQLTALETEHERALESSIRLEQAAIKERRSKRVWQIVAGVAIGGAIYAAVQ